MIISLYVIIKQLQNQINITYNNCYFFSLNSIHDIGIMEVLSRCTCTLQQQCKQNKLRNSQGAYISLAVVILQIIGK